MCIRTETQSIAAIMSLRTSTDTAKIIVNTVQCKNLVSDCFHVRSVQNCVRNVQDVLSPSQPTSSDQPRHRALHCRLLLPRAQLQPEPAAMSREDSPLHCNTFANYTVFNQKELFRFVNKQFSGKLFYKQ